MSQSTKYASPQEQLPPITVSLKELSAERQRYIVYPWFQRQDVWGIRQCQALIDTILLGDPVFPLEGYQTFTSNGQVMWGIIDGHQRITAILNFIDGLYKTWTIAQKRQAEPNSDLPVEPGTYFDDLPVHAKNYFLDYRLYINRIRKTTERELVTRFFRIQNHMPLSAAEKLKAHPSLANRAAIQIEKHPVWEIFYDGFTTREQVFQSSLYLLALELAYPRVTVDLLSGLFIHGLASGSRDHEVTEEIVAKVFQRLENIIHVFDGSHFTARTTIVAMYQSLMYLDKYNYLIQPSDQGRLTAWIGNIIEESKRDTSMPQYVRPITRILREKKQQEFWEKHLKTVMALFDINVGDEKLFQTEIIVPKQEKQALKQPRLTIPVHTELTSISTL